MNYKRNYGIIKAIKFQSNHLCSFKVYYHETKKGLHITINLNFEAKTNLTSNHTYRCMWSVSC